MRALIAGLCACALVAAGCGDDEERATTTTPTATAAATFEPAATATETPAESTFDQALWPPPAQAPTDPAEAARAFVQDYIGVDDPQLGEFRAGEPGAGEIEVFRTGEDGSRLDFVVSTVSLRQLDGEHWFVTSAQSEEVEVSAPEVLSAIDSPVKIEGRGRGFEGNVVLEVRAAFATDALAGEPVIAGAMEDLEPFSVELAFTAPATPTGAIVAKTGSGIEAADGFTAFPIAF